MREAPGNIFQPGNVTGDNGEISDDTVDEIAPVCKIALEHDRRPKTALEFSVGVMKEKLQTVKRTQETQGIRTGWHC